MACQVGWLELAGLLLHIVVACMGQPGCFLLAPSSVGCSHFESFSPPPVVACPEPVMVASLPLCCPTATLSSAVSSLQRSAVLVNPTDVSEAVELREWYDSVGRGATTSHVGEGLASAIK